MLMKQSILLCTTLLLERGFSFSTTPFPTQKTRCSQSPSSLSMAAWGEADSVDANRYNIPLDEAAGLWTVSVQESKNADREAGVPFVDSKSKDYFVDDISVEVSRDGGLGMNLLEIAGGRDDGIGITIIDAVTEGGNAARAGILPGDSIATIAVYEKSETSSGSSGLVEETTSRVKDCEARDFDGTIDALANFPGEDADTVYLGVKRIRRWPKVQVTVEYPASQCAEGFNPVKKLEFFAGENLQRALQNRGIVLSDPGNIKCDFCGKNACYVSIVKGKHLLNPMGKTEEKLMERNPNCRLSCKTTVGYNMQEGELSLKVNLSQW